MNIRSFVFGGVLAVAMILMACAPSARVPSSEAPIPNETEPPTNIPEPTATATPDPQVAALFSLPEGWTVINELTTVADMEGYGELIVADGLQGAWQAQFDRGDTPLETSATVLLYVDEAEAIAAYEQQLEKARSQPLFTEPDLIIAEGFWYGSGTDNDMLRVLMVQGCRALLVTQEKGTREAIAENIFAIREFVDLQFNFGDNAQSTCAE